jgi:hypothetical protein
VAELEARFADGRVVDDRQKPRRVRHDRPVEQGLVVVEQVHQEDAAVEVAGLVTELHHHPPELEIFGLGDVRHQPDEAESLLLASLKAVDLLRLGSRITSTPRFAPTTVSVTMSPSSHPCGVLRFELEAYDSATYGCVIFDGSTTRSNSSADT